MATTSAPAPNSPLVVVKRVAFAAFAVLFALSVAVQYNDPDPLPWMALYGCAAVVAGLAAAKRSMLVPAGVVGLVALVWALTLAPSRLFGPCRRRRGRRRRR